MWEIRVIPDLRAGCFMNIEKMSPEVALSLKDGDQVVFDECCNRGWGRFKCVGTIKKVYRSMSGLLWAEVEDIKSLEEENTPKKTFMKKQVRCLYAKVLK
jgi:hypothetical protein